MLDLNKTGFEDVVGGLKAYEERINEEGTRLSTQNTLLYSSASPQGRGNGAPRGCGRCSHQRGKAVGVEII